jgi:type II secretory pathway component PulF
MKKGMQTVIALVLAVLTMLALATVVYLVFFLPRLVAAWSAAGQTLSLVERILSKASFFCTSYGLILLPLLMGGFLACVLWAVISAKHVSTRR